MADEERQDGGVEDLVVAHVGQNPRERYPDAACVECRDAAVGLVGSRRRETHSEYRPALSVNCSPDDMRMETLAGTA